MKIVDRETFLAMPAGTVFSKYAPCYMEDLQIKGESLPDDFCYQGIADAIEHAGSDGFSDRLREAELLGQAVSMDFNSQCRDGCFDEGQMFAVWERSDVLALIARLQETLE